MRVVVAMGTENLTAAAKASGLKRFVAES